MTNRSDVNTSLTVAILNLVVVVTIGVVLTLFAFANNSLLQGQKDQAVRDACGEAALRKYPDALTTPEALAKYVTYSTACATLNGVSARPSVRLP